MRDQRCRICLEEGNFESIFRVNGSLQLSTKIMSLTNVAIHPNDGLPSTICLPCTEKLENCVAFVEQCIKSDSYLRSNFHKNVNGISTDNDVEFEDKILKGNNTTRNDLIINSSTVTNFNADKECTDNTNDNDENDILENVKIECKKSQKQQCFKCGKVMSSRFRLKTHLRTHTGERPHTCPHCNKDFSLAQNLKVHLRIHTGEKPFNCSICGEAFAHSAGLAVHRRKHTGQQPYQCILCPRSFRTVGHLQYHVRRHTGAKNFECHVCGRGFITRSDLKQHMVTHTGEKPHVCCICGMRMTRASHLKRHMRFIHEKEKKSLSNYCVEQKNDSKINLINDNNIEKLEQ